MNNYYPYLVVAIAAVVTMLIRFLPFIVFHGRKTPEIITYFGRVLPPAIMGMLVVYCLRKTEILAGKHGIPELISSLLVILLHKWKRNTLLSIIAGTVCYMILIHVM